VAILKLLEAEVEARVAEIVDLLVRPAGEFAPRVRRVLLELLHACAAKLEQFETADTQPIIPFTPPPKAPPRAPQETMEITIDDIIAVQVHPPRGRK
jgi:hypothetical protein